MFRRASDGNDPDMERDDPAEPVLVLDGGFDLASVDSPYDAAEYVLDAD